MLTNSGATVPGRPFRPGKSGNPAGRPPGGEELRKRILKALHQKRDGKRAVDALIDVLVRKSLGGDLRAARLLVEYAYGKPVSILDAVDRAGVQGQSGLVIIEVPEEAVRGLPPPAG